MLKFTRVSNNCTLIGFYSCMVFPIEIISEKIPFRTRPADETVNYSFSGN